MSDQVIQFELVSPEAILASEPAKMVVVPGEDGDFGVLAEHMPLLSSLRPGVVSVTTVGGETRRIFVAGGFADVSAKTCTVLAEEAVNVDELSEAILEQKLKDLTEDLGLAGDDTVKRAHIQHGLRITKAKLQAVTGRLVA